MDKISANALRGVSLLALMAPLPAIAQTTQAPTTPNAAAEFISLEEVVVTARRREESLLDVPAVVNVVTPGQLAKMNIREFTEIQTLVPGLALSTNSNGIGGNAQIRGVNFDINASGNNPTVEFYLNDAPITAGVVLQQMYDIGQIEVLRGPQGTLRGRASPSGSITVTSKKPDLYRGGGTASVTQNDIGTTNVTGAVNIPIIEGIAALRVAGLHDDGDANLVRTVNTNVPHEKPRNRTESGRISALVTPTDWLRLEGVYQTIARDSREYDHAESFSVVNPSAPASTTLIRAADRKGFQARPRNVAQNFDIYNWRAELSLSGQQLIYQGQHYTQDLDSDVTQDPANIFPTTLVRQHTVSHVKSTSHEIRLQNQERVFGYFDYAVGYFDNKNDTPTSLNSPTVLRLPLAFGGGVAQVLQTAITRTGNSREKAFFANVTGHIGESTQVSGGLRHIDYEDTGALVIATPGSPVVTRTNGQNAKKWIYTASAQHYFSREVMVYVNTGSSFRPGINAVGNFNLTRSPLESSFLDLPPETSKSYEAGVKTALWDRRIHLNVSGYHQTFKNYPYRSAGGVYYVNTTATTPLTQQVSQFNFVAAVPVEVNGVEAEFAYNITPRWNLNWVASYADGKIKNGVVACNDLNSDGRPDAVTSAPSLAQLQAAVGGNNLSKCSVSQRSANQSPFSTTFQSEYTWEVPHGLEVYARGLVNYSGRSQGDPTNTYDNVKAYGLLNLFTGLREKDGKWELAVYGKNVFDTTKVLTRTNPLSTGYQQLPGAIIGGVPTITGRPSAVSATSTYNSITTTQPREFGVTLRMALGSR